MNVNSIFAAIEFFFTEVLFFPFEYIRTMNNWWIQNLMSFVFILIAIVAFGYWLNQLMKTKNIANS